MKPLETIDFNIRWAWARISRIYNAEAQKHQGTMSIGYVLLNIEKEGTPSTKLGPKMGMESRSLTRTLKSREEAGIIERKKDTSDKRLVRVFLTEEGKRQRELSRKVVITFNDYVHRRIDAKRLNIFLDVFGELNDILDNENIFETESNPHIHPSNHEKH